jgi:hypothetical protein
MAWPRILNPGSSTSIQISGAGSGSSSGFLDLDFRNYTGVYDLAPRFRVFDRYASNPLGGGAAGVGNGAWPGEPRMYIDTIGGIATASYITISAHPNGLSGDRHRFEVVDNTDVYMFGIRSDVDAPSVLLKTNGSTNSDHLLCIDVNNFHRLRIKKDGAIWWGSSSAANEAAMDVNLYRNAANVLRTDDSFYVGDTSTHNIKSVINAGNCQLICDYNSEPRVTIVNEPINAFGAGFGATGDGGIRLGQAAGYGYICGNGGGLYFRLHDNTKNFTIINLPTADPHVVGALWRSTNTVMISTG